jgi:Spy/CpxP family protein refolding chaperone
MKTIFLVLLALTPFSLIHAQEKRDTIHYTPVKKTERLKLKQDVGLSREQVKGLKSIQRSFKQQLEDLRGNTSLSQQEKLTRLRAINSQRTEKMASLLSPEQLQKLQSLRAARKAQQMQE